MELAERAQAAAAELMAGLEDERTRAVQWSWWLDWRTSGPVEMAQWNGGTGAGGGGCSRRRPTSRSVPIDLELILVLSMCIWVGGS